MGQTLIEKIATRYAVGLERGEKVHALDYITIRPKHVMTHDNTGAVIPKFKSIGATAMADPMRKWRRLTTKVVMTMAGMEAPLPSMATAMNWELPAKTSTDISPTCQGARPAFWASTPKARPMGA